MNILKILFIILLSLVFGIGGYLLALKDADRQTFKAMMRTVTFL